MGVHGRHRVRLLLVRPRFPPGGRVVREGLPGPRGARLAERPCGHHAGPGRGSAVIAADVGVHSPVLRRRMDADHRRTRPPAAGRARPD